MIQMKEHAAHPLREELMKELVDAHLKTTAGPLVLNVGGFHVQKRHLMGTPKVWLGEHLASAESEAAGSSFSLFVGVARNPTLFGGPGSCDVPRVPPPGELFAALAREVGDRRVFVPLDAPERMNL